ncbi:MAG: hypothetical protein M1389_12980 [Chloroflexi bacterium]|nr:hypothetical protein [Chloroflexota bacterium]
MDIAFLKDFIANMLATAIGAVLGIPLGLWINRQGQLASEKREATRRTEEASERERRVLGLIETKLEGNERVIEAWSGIQRRSGRPMLDGSRLKDELWRALSDGGELSWLRDLELIDAISNAYFATRLAKSRATEYRDISTDKRGRASVYAAEDAYARVESAVAEAARALRASRELIARSVHGPLREDVPQL